MPENTETAIAVADQRAQAPVVYQLDDFPEDRFNRLIPTETIRIPTDLLVPVVQVVRLSIDEADKDVYSSRDIPNGHKALTARGINKVLTAAGVSFSDERRVDDGTNADLIGVTVTASMLLPTGQRISAPGTKWINLNDQSWSSPAQRAKYKSFFYEHVSTRARNRAARAILSLKSSYTIAELSKPFAVVSFAPNMNHPLIQQRMVDNLAPIAAQLYGGQSEPVAIGPGAPVQELREIAADDEAAAASEDTAASSTPDEPAWMKPAAAPADQPEPTFIERLQTIAESSSLKGAMTEEQIGTLAEVLGPVREIIGSVVRAAWGEAAAKSLTAAQAAAIIAVSNTYEVDTDFHAAWTAASESTKAAA